MVINYDTLRFENSAIKQTFLGLPRNKSKCRTKITGFKNLYIPQVEILMLKENLCIYRLLT